MAAILLVFLFFSSTASAAYTLTTCHGNSSASCYVDESLLSSGNWDEVDALGELFKGCNGLNWDNKRNWCYGGDNTVNGLREADDDTVAAFNAQCITNVITDPCSGDLVQYPVDYVDTISDDDYSTYEWDQLTCSGAEYVTSISFSGDLLFECDLAEVGTNLTQLRSLLYLTIKQNRITGDVPAFLEGCDSLIFVDLSENSLDGTIPHGVGVLTNLGTFTVNENSLTGSIPPGFGNMTALTTLNLEDNLLTGVIPSDMSQMSELQKFTAQNNLLTGALPSLEAMTSLAQLRVQNNDLTGSIPGESFLLGARSTLKYMLMQNNQLTGSLPTSMDQFTALKYFRVDGNNLTGYVPSLPSTLLQCELYGPFNDWHCPFPVAANSVIQAGIAEVNCTCMPGSSCNPESQCRTSCSRCEAGKFTNATAQPSCTNCAVGRASSSNTTVGSLHSDESYGTTQCGLCKVGYYMNQSGALDCETCQLGRSTNSNGTIVCPFCEIGKYSDEIQLINCKSCQNGKISDYEGAKECSNCPYGKSSLKSTTTCTDCSPGQYGPSQGLVNCTQCYPGSYSNQSGMSNCTDCDIGEASDAYGRSNECLQCKPGRYANSTGRSECYKCNAALGLAQNRSGASDCHYCPDGHYSGDGTNCTLCPAGRAGEGPTSSRVITEVGGVSNTVFQCSACSAGTFADHKGMGYNDCTCTSGCELPFNDSTCDSDGCTYCGTGYVSLGDPDPTWSAGHTSCTICPSGTYWDHVSTPCVNCSWGRYQPDEGEEHCDNCPSGYYQPYEGMATCVACEPGYAQPDIGNHTCPACTPGKFTNHTASSTCTNCHAGHYQPDSASTSCLSCDPGYVQPLTGNTSCYPCPPGSIANASAARQCISCPDGYYQPNSAKSQCLYVPAGYYRTSTSSISACPAGKWSGARGNSISDCHACPSGTFATNASTECTNCTSGTYAPAQSGKCENCKGGTYSDDSAATCILCEVGKYTVTVGTSAETGCVDCPGGTYLDFEGGSSLANCTYCKTGSYSDTGSSACTQCVAGKYAPTIGTNIGGCIDCPAGTSLNVDGGSSLTNCTDCRTGSYSPAASTSCTLCAVGKYSNVTGISEGCRDCPAGTSLDVEGGSSRSNCSACKAGSTSPRASSTCTLCTVGKYTPKVGTPEGDCLNCSAGTYLSVEGGSSISNCTECKAGSTSSKSSETCTLCPVGTYAPSPNTPTDGGCIDCPAGTSLNYQGGSSLNNCTNCSAGTSSHNGSATCTNCPTGKFTTKQATKTPCEDCHRGKYASSTGTSISCIKAKPGQYVSSYGASSYQSCEAGTYSYKNESWNCTKCDAGTFSDSSGSSSCLYCPNGTSSNINRTECDICEAGKYSHFKSTLGLCVDCAIDYYQPDHHSDKCLKCSDEDHGQYTYSTDGATGSIACVEKSSASECGYGFETACEDWFQIGAASMSFLVIFLVCFGVGSTYFIMAKSRFNAKFEDYVDDDDVMYGTGRAGRYEVTCKKLDVFEGPHVTERRVAQKSHGDVFTVIASKEDWLLLDEGEGWVLGFDKVKGARVSLIDDNDYSLDGRMSEVGRKSKGNFRSSIYGGRLSISYKKTPKNDHRNDDDEEGGGGFGIDHHTEKANKRKSRRASIAALASQGKKMARRASSIITHPVQAMTELYEASVQNSVLGNGASRAQQAYYEVDIDLDEEATEELKKNEMEEKKKAAFSFMEQDEEEEDNGLLSTVAKSLPMSKIFVKNGDKNNKIPPPPSETNPFDLIETRKYLGSEGGVEAALPPPRPTDLPPSLVPRELFDDAHKCTYEVQYYKVHIRAEPSLRSSIIGELSMKDIVYVVEENRHWVLVKAGEPNGIAGGPRGHPGGWVLRFQKKFGPLLRLVDAEIWNTYYEASTGRPYYVNRATSESTWRHPSKRPSAPKPPNTPPPNDAVSLVTKPLPNAGGGGGGGDGGSDASGGGESSSIESPPKERKRQSML